MTVSRDFADYCCDLMSGAGPCVPKRMFGGWGISTDGLTIAILADLGKGEKLWLKASDDTRAQFEAAGAERFTYTMTRNGVSAARGMNYYSAPEDAMDSPDAMVIWARLALDCALKAKATAPKAVRKTAKAITTVKTAKPLKTGKASKPAKSARS